VTKMRVIVSTDSVLLLTASAKPFGIPQVYTSIYAHTTKELPNYHILSYRYRYTLSNNIYPQGERQTTIATRTSTPAAITTVTVVEIATEITVSVLQRM